MAPPETTTTEAATTWIGEARRLVGVAVLALALGGWIAWFGWRLQCLGLHPICIAALVLELAAAVGSVAIAVGLLAADEPRGRYQARRGDSHRFALAVADIVGRTRAVDLHRDIRWLARHVRDPQHRTAADIAMAAVLLDGPRRLGVVAVVTVGLLVGVPPVPMPPLWALASGATAMIASSLALVVLAGGRIRVGDRTRWTFAAVGELFSRKDRDDVAPRRWVGAVAAVVVVSIAVALRGISDRWTHGLSPMTDSDRRAAMALALLVVVGALYTLRTTTAPELRNAHLVSRHLEERTARHSAIGAAVTVGLVGLVAGIVPGAVDATEPEPTERISDHEVSEDPGDG